MGIDLYSTQFEENGSIKRSKNPFFHYLTPTTSIANYIQNYHLLKNYNKISCNKKKEAAFFRQPLVPFAGLSSKEVAEDISILSKFMVSAV
jgi:hypothetical protein